MDLVCRMPFEASLAGQAAVFYLLGNHALSGYYDLMIFAQVHGHVQVSDKWVRGAHHIGQSIEKSRQSIHSADTVTSFPEDPTPEKSRISPLSHCMFASTKVALSPQALLDNGMFVECELPLEMLPSHKGRGVRIQYYLTVQLQCAQQTRSYHFPFIVHGGGLVSSSSGQSSSASTSSVSFICGGINAFPANTLPSEEFLHSELKIQSTMPDDEEFHKKPVENVQFSVRDENHICDICLPSTQCMIGDGIDIHFDFSTSQQNCVAVRASLVMREKRIDGSTIQERSEFSVLKNAEDADSLVLRIQVPSECSTSFVSDVITVEHVLMFEFYSEDENGAVLDDPLSFAQPITLLHNHSIISPTNGRLSRHDYTQLCMESSIIRVPIVVDH